jgi:hypothetical protein
MEATAAVPAQRTPPGLLAALALIVVVPATVALPLWEARPYEWSSSWDVWLTVLMGGAIVVLIGKETFGVARSLGLLLASWLALALSLFVLFAIGFSEALACGGQTTHPLRWWIAVSAGMVYVVVGFSAVRKGRWWGLPAAILLGLTVFAGLTLALPGPPAPDDCSG